MQATDDGIVLLLKDELGVEQTQQIVGNINGSRGQREVLVPYAFDMTF